MYLISLGIDILIIVTGVIIGNVLYNLFCNKKE